MNPIKITCTAEQKDRFIDILAGSVCPFMNKPCTGGNVDCFKCVEDEVDWEIVEPIKDFKELTIAEFEKHCGEHGGCSNCAYLSECAHAFSGRDVKEPGVALGNRIVKGAMNVVLNEHVGFGGASKFSEGGACTDKPKMTAGGSNE